MQTRIVDYVYLQIFDLLTTLAFLSAGVEEANPLVNAAMQMTNSPLMGLVLIKSVALTLGFFCWKQGRTSLLTKANVFFAALVVWNLVALALGQTA